MHQYGSPYCVSLEWLSGTYGSKVTPFCPLNAGEIAEAILVYIFKNSIHSLPHPINYIIITVGIIQVIVYIEINIFVNFVDLLVLNNNHNPFNLFQYCVSSLISPIDRINSVGTEVTKFFPSHYRTNIGQYGHDCFQNGKEELKRSRFLPMDLHLTSWCKAIKSY